MLYLRGQRSKAESPAYGFHSIIKDVISETSLDESVISKAQLTEAIYYGDSFPHKIRALLAGMVDSEDNLTLQVEQVLQARAPAYQLYWTSVSNWLRTWLAQDLGIVDEVLISGGAATAFHQELSELFTGSTLIGGGGVKREIRQMFGLTTTDPMVSRLVDAYGVYKWLLQVHQPVSTLHAQPTQTA